MVFSEKFCCPVSGFTIAEIEPRLFSFNSPFGACKHCNGLGTELYFSPDLIVEDENLTLRQGAIAIWQGVQERFYQQVLSAMASHYKFSLDMPFKNLPEEIKQKIFYGTDEEEVEIKIEDGLKAIKIKKPFEGVVNSLKKRFAESESDSIQDELAKFQTTRICNDCHGYRLNEQSLQMRVV